MAIPRLTAPAQRYSAKTKYAGWLDRHSHTGHPAASADAGTRYDSRRYVVIQDGKGGLRVSIVIPVLDKLSFTRQCLDRIWRNTDEAIEYEVIVVDNGSTDGTADWFADVERFPRPVRYLRHSENLGFARANNAGARLSHARHLLFLNNDTLVQPGWLSEMLHALDSDQSVGVVGIKQLFPYTNTIYHTGIVFTPEGRPEHLYPHLDASLPQVNEQRDVPGRDGRVPAHRARALRRVRRIRRGVPERLRGRRSVHEGRRARTEDRLLHAGIHLPLRADL